ncbi:MAG TPA: LacI family DNA-binding transcriptional regulator [Bryobacteraceae bacterium]|jgi:LacI family transcriptional regulator
MAVRMKDIARDLGVSVVTISKVLRNHSDISTDTRERVLKRMKELNYRPNLAARALITGKTQTMGLVVPGLVHSFFAQVAKGISSVLREQSYSLLITSSEEDVALEQQEIEQMLAHRVDTLLIASMQWSVETFRRIEEHQTPYVLVDRRFAGLHAHFVGSDDEVIGRMATNHLIEQGCERIAHIRGREISTGNGRYEGFRQALAQHGRVAMPGYVLAGRTGDDAGDISGYEAMKHLLALDPHPDGVVCYNDPNGIGAIKAIHEAGLRVPHDIAVIGVGNAWNSESMQVPLSTIDQNCQAIGVQAAQLAFRLIREKVSQPLRPESILIEPTLLVRESSRRRR